jgi:hypothetical protein
LVEYQQQIRELTAENARLRAALEKLADAVEPLSVVDFLGRSRLVSHLDDGFPPLTEARAALGGRATGERGTDG